MVMAFAPYLLRTAFCPRYMAAEVSRVSRETSSMTAAFFSQRSATARASSLSALAQASFNSAKATRVMGMPMNSPPSPASWSRTARILEAFIRARHSVGDRTARESLLQASRPDPGVDFTRACAVAATKSAGEPPFRTTSKHRTAAIWSFISEDATNPTLGALLRRNPAVYTRKPPLPAYWKSAYRTGLPEVAMVCTTWFQQFIW